MNTESPQSTLADQILSEENREIRMLAARGLFPLPPHELLPLQVALTSSDDAELADVARQALTELEPKIVAQVLAESSDTGLLAFFAEHHGHPVIVEAILRNRDLSTEILSLIAPRLSPELQEVFLLRQDLIVSSPGVLERLEENPALSSFSQRRIYEYREHLIPRQRKTVRAKPVEEIEELEEEELSADEVETAIAEVRDLPAEGEQDEVTGLSESQIRALPVPVRLKLARGAPRSLRSLLIKDKNPTVAVTVVVGNALTESEVEQIASSRSVVEEVLNAIAKDRQWGRKYGIVQALVRNPRTSVGLAVRLAPRLSTRDLRNLSRDRNVSEAVRAHAARLYRIKAV